MASIRKRRLEYGSFLEDTEDDYFNPTLFCAIIMDDKCSSEEDGKCLQQTMVFPSTLDEENKGGNFVYKMKKRHACKYCEKTFGWTTDLKRHILIHTGERPFQCSSCLATFTRNFLLQKHQSRRHPCLSPGQVENLNEQVAKKISAIKSQMMGMSASLGSASGKIVKKSHKSPNI